MQRLLVTVSTVWLAFVASFCGICQYTGPTFTDVTAAAGINFTHSVGSLVAGQIQQPQMTGGAAAGDYDGDGRVDLFITSVGAGDALFRNLGDGTFEDVSAGEPFAENRRSNGAAWGDIDNDGDLDLYVSTIGDCRFYLYINGGDGSFTEDAVSRGASLALEGCSISDGSVKHSGFSVSFGDYDRDGWLDIHTTQWGVAESSSRKYSVLLHNLGSANPGHFEEVTVAANVQLSGDGEKIYAFASRFSDLDNDGWPDLAVAADFGTSQLFWNNGDGTFTDGTASPLGTDENGMGSAIGDFDGDGNLDWFVTSIFDPVADRCADATIDCNWGSTGNRLYRNLGNRAFEDATTTAGVVNGDWGWGTTFLDFDNDGRLDLTMTNGVDFPFLESALFSLPSLAESDFDDLDNGMLSIDLKSGFTDNGHQLANATAALAVTTGQKWVVDDHDDLFVLERAGTVLQVASKLTARYDADPMRLWLNNGVVDGNVVYADVSANAGVTDTGSGKGLLAFDYDLDGDLDIVVVNNSASPVLYRNNGGNSNNWLRVKTTGTLSNRDGIGAVITVEPTTGGAIQIREISGGSNFLGQNEFAAHFGLADHVGTVAAVSIRWPSGAAQRFEDVPVNTTLQATEPGNRNAVLALGWNLIGVIAEADYPVENDKLGGRIWRWNTSAAHFEIVQLSEKLIPGTGYWVYAVAAGTLF